ncbi:hypothetical protein [Dictyobacter arantiisoli]|uniref:Uncharacterized protein n=1 Tax=Dictyobacter arantiisoli TaxID=2014874 RepID=A0A5A5TGQ8_9CHLR|nr:hypothetical protein [Dictyobacter arantiisoli]GCF10243.1 hypothetical protein KDI_38070 [Dictyobacter arantiisoli]
MIIGGLIAVAAIALLLAFLLMRSDESAQQTQAQTRIASAADNSNVATERVSAPIEPARNQQASVTVPIPSAREEERSQPSVQSYTQPHRSSYSQNQTFAPDTYTVPRGESRYEPPLSPLEPLEADVPALNRRLYELAGQLRSVQRQSQQIERTLIQLSSILESIDQRGRHPSDPLYAGQLYGAETAEERE